MNKRLLLLLLLFAGSPSFSLTLQKTIPNNSIYGGVNIQDNLNTLMYKVLSPQLKSLLYPNGLNTSSIKGIITGLKALNVKDIEFFTNDDWNILVKINGAPLKPVGDLLSNLLNHEGFMSKLNTVNSNNITISSSNPDLAGNTFYIKKEQDYVLITNNKAAFSAWKTKNTIVTLYEQGLKAIKKEHVFGFLYETDPIYSNNKPLLLTVEDNSKADILDIQEIQKNKNFNPLIPSFLKDNPIVFLSSQEDLDTTKMNTIKNFMATTFILVPSLRVPINLLLSNEAGTKRITFEFNNGSLVNINEKKYNELDLSFTFEVSDIKKIEKLLEEQLKNNKTFDLKKQGTENQKIMTITPQIPAKKAQLMGIVPIYLLFNPKGFVSLSMNKNTILELANNISNNKKEMNINKNQSTYFYTNMNDLLDKFPILSSLLSQFGIDMKSIASISSYNQSNIDEGYTQNNTQIQFNK